MKSITILKINLKSFILSLAGIILLSLTTSCTVDEIENGSSTKAKTFILKEQVFHKGDSLQYSGKPNDSLPVGEIIPPIKNTPPPPPVNP